MSRFRTIRLLLKIACIILLLSSACTTWAQPAPQHYFKVKNNMMYLVVSKNIPAGTLDTFIMKYNLADIGLRRFVEQGAGDSLSMTGWTIDSSDANIYVIRKPLEGAGNILKEPGNLVYSPVPTPEDWRVVGGNRVIYGANDFREGYEFKKEKDIVYFSLKGYPAMKQVRLAGNFTNWQWGAFPMIKSGDGWTVGVKLKPGKYYYKFILNHNSWITDPANNLSENDGRGNENSVYFVTNNSFELKGYPDAKKVFLSGSFNNWAKSKLPMEKAGSLWKLDLYLDSGTYLYKYVVDGKIVTADKSANESVLAIGKPHTFTLKGYSNAKKVTLAGNFNDWQPDQLRMEKTADGWKFSYVLGPGNYQYKFIVDGDWITDPENRYIITDTKGNKNSFLIIGANYKFRLKGFAEAKQVFLAGDFNEWSSKGLPMTKVGDEWICPVYLAPGKHLYKFVVDGNWLLDPSNKSWEENRYGTGNSVIWIEKEV